MELEQLGRKELQSLAKSYGIKANQSNAALVEALSFAFVNQYNTTNDIVVAEKENVNKADESEVENINIESKLDSSVEPVNIPSTDNELATDTFNIGDQVEAFYNHNWLTATIKRINKNSYRVLASDGKEATVKLCEVRRIVNIEANLVATEESKEAENLVDNSEDKECTPFKEANDEDLAAEHDCYSNNGIEDCDQSEAESEVVLEDYLNISDAPALFEADISMEMLFIPRRSSIKTPNRRQSAGSVTRQSWNSCSKVSGIPESNMSDEAIEATQKSAKKTFANSPLRPVPAIQPKMNATQRLRMEALQRKNAEKTQSAGAIAGAGIRSVKSTPIVSSNKPTPNFGSGLGATARSLTSTAVSRPKVQFEPIKSAIVSSKPAGRKSTPNFKSLHQKQFQRQKSIASVVSRDTTINKKMDAAFEQAATHSIPDENSFKPNQRPTIPSKPFVKDLSNAKEHRPFKEGIKPTERQENRREKFMESKKDMRSLILQEKRQGGVNNSNPFHYVAG